MGRQSSEQCLDGTCGEPMDLPHEGIEVPTGPADRTTMFALFFLNRVLSRPSPTSQSMLESNATPRISNSDIEATSSTKGTARQRAINLRRRAWHPELPPRRVTPGARATSLTRNSQNSVHHFVVTTIDQPPQFTAQRADSRR